LHELEKPKSGITKSSLGRISTVRHKLPHRLERPNGPLAKSHDRGRGGKQVPCRYDFIYATPDIGVTNVDYYYDEKKLLSDHAIVVADLEFSD
jgi:endonuclease/exonuclease/phosphatase family metal-dependent hydrolase